MAAPYAVDGDQYRTVDRRMGELKRQLNQKDGSPINPDTLAAMLQLVAENGAGGIPALSKPYPVPINQDLSLEQAIAAAGFFGGVDRIYENLRWSDWKHPDTKRAKQKELLLFSPHAFYEEEPSRKELLNALAGLNLQAESIRELIAFGQHHASRGPDFPILAMGAVYEQGGLVSPRMAQLLPVKGEFRLDFVWRDAVLHPQARVLVSRA